MKSGGETTGTGLAPNIASLLCYICMPITSIIFLVIEKQDRDVRFHAWQATLLGVGYIIAVIGIQAAAAMLGWVASFLGTMVGYFRPLLLLGTVILWGICLIKSYQGERWRIPVLGDIAAQKANVT